MWKRYNLVLEKNEVNPTRLLDSGRIRPRNVLIISNVDNRHHIDIVLAFSKYLKAHCAVGEVYFALDPHTGITSQADHDPWKWAQVKSMFSKKATKVDEIFTVDLTLCSNCQINGEDFVNFCGLLRKHEL